MKPPSCKSTQTWACVHGGEVYVLCGTLQVGGGRLLGDNEAEIQGEKVMG